jgi:hypothetical protein
MRACEDRRMRAMCTSADAAASTPRSASSAALLAAPVERPLAKALRAEPAHHAHRR